MPDANTKEITDLIESLRGDISDKDVEAKKRLDDIEEKALARETTVKDLRAELDDVKQKADEREQKIVEIQQKARQQLVAADPIRSYQEGLRMFGMMLRQAYCSHASVPMPSRYSGELKLIEDYRAERAQRATLEADAITGSYLVPTITSTEIIDAVEELSDLLNRVEFMPGLPGNVDIPILVSRPTLQPKRASVDSDMTQDSPAFGQLSMEPKEMYTFFGVDDRLMQMSAIDLGGLSVDLCRDGVIEGLAKWLVVADGSAAFNSLTGILNEPTYRVTMSAGKTSFGDVDNEELNRALSQLLKRGRARASYLMSLYVQGVLEDQDRSGQTKVITHRDDGTPLCKMHPLVIDEEMPDQSDSKISTPFMSVGDLATWIVGLVGGISVSVSTEALWKQNQVGFKSVINGDIKRKPVATQVTMRTAAIKREIKRAEGCQYAALGR